MKIKKRNQIKNELHHIYLSKPAFKNLHVNYILPLLWFGFFILMAYQSLWDIKCQSHPCIRTVVAGRGE